MVCVGENDLPSSMAVEMESAKVEMLTGELGMEAVGVWAYQYTAASMSMHYSQNDRWLDPPDSSFHI